MFKNAAETVSPLTAYRGGSHPHLKYRFPGSSLFCTGEIPADIGRQYDISAFFIGAVPGSSGIHRLKVQKSLYPTGCGLFSAGTVRTSPSPGTRDNLFLPGLFCLTVSWISREGLGYGDSLMVLICGLSLGFSRTVILVSAAFFFAALLSIFLLSLGKADRKTQLPFLPFLFLADMLWEILFWLGSGAL